MIVDFRLPIVDSRSLQLSGVGEQWLTAVYRVQTTDY
jgi:hypothetical protein